MVLLYWSIFLLDTGNISLLICKQSNFFKSFTGHCEFYVIDLWCFPLISVWLSRGTLTCMPFCPSRGSLSSCPWVGPEQTALQPVKLRDDRWPPENSLRSPMLYQTSSLRLLSSRNCLAPCFLVPFSLAYEGSLSACADWYAAEDSKRSLCGSPELPVCVASSPLSYPKMVTASASPNDSLCPLKSANDRLHVCSPTPCHSLDTGVIVGLVSLFSFSRGCSQFFRLYGGRAISKAFNSSWAEVEALQ